MISSSESRSQISQKRLTCYAPSSTVLEGALGSMRALSTFWCVLTWSVPLLGVPTAPPFVGSLVRTCDIHSSETRTHTYVLKGTSSFSQNSFKMDTFVLRATQDTPPSLQLQQGPVHKTHHPQSSVSKQEDSHIPLLQYKGNPHLPRVLHASSKNGSALDSTDVHSVCTNRRRAHRGGAPLTFSWSQQDTLRSVTTPRVTSVRFLLAGKFTDFVAVPVALPASSVRLAITFKII